MNPKTLYRVARWDPDAQESWTQALRLGAGIDKLLERAQQYEGPAMWKPRGRDNWIGPIRPKLATAAINQRLRNRRDDIDLDTYLLKLAGSGVILAIREVLPNPLAAEPPIGTCPLKTWHREVFGQFDDVESWGIYNPRNIAGTSTPSQHAYANAEDVHGSAKEMAEVFEFTWWNGKRLAVAHTIYNHQIWTPGDASPRPYTGSNPHTDHVHTDFNPQIAGAFRPIDCEL
jgi:hypothetical protein